MSKKKEKGQPAEKKPQKVEKIIPLSSLYYLFSVIMAFVAGNSVGKSGKKIDLLIEEVIQNRNIQKIAAAFKKTPEGMSLLLENSAENILVAFIFTAICLFLLKDKKDWVGNKSILTQALIYLTTLSATAGVTVFLNSISPRYIAARAAFVAEYVPPIVSINFLEEYLPIAVFVVTLLTAIFAKKMVRKSSDS